MYRNDGKDVNLDAIWSSLPCPGTINTGRHQLACLARLVLSIVANSAGCEQLFSRMGDIHTKLRNRLHFKRMHDLATVAMDIDAQHQAAGLTRKRTRRHFDAPRQPPALRTSSEAEGYESDWLPDPPTQMAHDAGYIDSDDEDSENESGEQGLTTLAARFNEALDEDNDDDAADEPSTTLPVPNQPQTRPRRLRLYFSKAHAIPLSEMFNFLGSVDGVEEGLGVFWSAGVTNLAREEDVYRAVASMRE